MSNIFTSPYQSTPMVWSAQGGIISWSKQSGGTNANSALNAAANGRAQALATINRITVSATRGVQPMYPLSNQSVVMLVGSPNVSVAFSNLFGPTDKLQAFLEAFGGVCQNLSIQITPVLKGNKCSNNQDNPQKIQVAGLVGVSFNYSLDSGQNGMSIANGQFTLQGTHIRTVK